MGLPAGSVSSAYDSRLQVTFSGVWNTSLGDNFYGQTKVPDIQLRCFVGSGASRLTSLLNIANQSTLIELPYTGGSGWVAVGMELVSHFIGGVGGVSAYNLTISAYFIKR